MFKESSLLGVHRGGPGVYANPPDSLVIEKGDTLFGLAYDGKHFAISRVRHCA